MRTIQTIEEARAISAVRLTHQRRFGQVGDLFRLSPKTGIFLWGRLIKRARFFGHEFESKLVYVYDVIGRERPEPELLSPSNLIIGPRVGSWLLGNYGIGAATEEGCARQTPIR